MIDWELLQIEPTSDIGLIKKAYAARVKVIRPDEKATEFSALHNAYKSAIKHAKNAMDQEIETSEDQMFFSKQDEQAHLSGEKTPFFNKNEYLADQQGAGKSYTNCHQHHEVFIENSFHNLINKNEQNVLEETPTPDLSDNQQITIENLDDILQICDDILSEDDEHVQFQRWSQFSQKQTLLNKKTHFKVSIYLINAFYSLIKAVGDGKPHAIYSTVGLGTQSIILLNNTFLWQEEQETLKAYVNSNALDSILEYIDNETPNHKPLSAVQGGISALNRYSKDEIAMYEAAKSSFFTLKALFIMWCLVLLVVFCVSLLTTLNGLLFRPSNFQNFMLVLSQFIVCFKLYQNSKLAFNCVWLIAVIALLLFPFGTIWGIFAIRKLRKARHYFKFANNPPITK